MEKGASDGMMAGEGVLKGPRYDGDEGCVRRARWGGGRERTRSLLQGHDVWAPSLCETQALGSVAKVCVSFHHV